MSFDVRLTALILVLIGSVVYFNVLFNGFIVGDDEDQIVNHLLVHSLNNIPTLFTGSTYFETANSNQWGPFYRPIMLTCFALMYSLFGPDPLFFHLFQIILHVANAILFLCLVNHFLRRLDIALIAALIFLVHPIQSEAILHAANLQEVLFFFFGSSAYMYSLKKPLASYSQLFILSSLQLLALFSKETAVSFIILTIITAYILKLKKRQSILIVSLTSLCLYAVFRFFIAGVGLAQPSIGQILTLSTIDRLAHVPIILKTYLLNAAIPINQAVFQTWIINHPHLSQFLLPLIICIGILLLLSLSYRWISRSQPHKHIFSIFASWFLVGWFLHSQLIPLYLTYADRWFYFTIAGLLGLLSVIAAVKFKSSLPRQVWILVTVYLIILSSLTIRRTFDWRSTETLLEADLNKAPQAYYLQNLLATTYIRQENYNPAAMLVKQSLETFPFMGNLSNQGIISLHQNNPVAARQYFIHALEYGENLDVYRNLINFLVLIEHDYETAQVYGNKALSKYPQNADLHLMQAIAAYETDNINSAQQHIEIAYRLNQNQMTTYVRKTIDNEGELDLSAYISR